MTSPTVGIIEAVDSVVAKARTLNSDIPEKIVLVLDSGKRKNSMIHGHFAKESWEGDYSEIKLGTESLARGPVPTLGTVLHELSHAVAYKRGVQDTSNKGRYHNSKFREIGLSMGIHLEQAGSIGWSQTTVPDSTRDAYADEVKGLEAAITTHRKGYVEGGIIAKPKVSKPGTKMECGCGEPVTVTKKWFEAVGQWATCGICHEGFELNA